MANNKQPNKNLDQDVNEIMKRWIKEADDEIKSGVVIKDNISVNKLDPYTEELINKLIKEADEEIKQQ